mgnify:FL=1
MSKIGLILSIIMTGSVSLYADLPLHGIFGLIATGVMVNAKEIEPKRYTIISTVVLTSVIGWGIASGVKEIMPSWFEGGLKIFSRLVITSFGYLTILHLIKNKTIQKIIETKLKKK